MPKRAGARIALCFDLTACQAGTKVTHAWACVCDGHEQVFYDVLLAGGSPGWQRQLNPQNGRKEISGGA